MKILLIIAILKTFLILLGYGQDPSRGNSNRRAHWNYKPKAIQTAANDYEISSFS